METHEFTVDEDRHSRLDAYLASRIGLSRSAVQKLIESGQVLVNSKPSRASHKLSRGERIRVELPPAEPSDLTAENIPLDVVYEDSSLIVVNKPKGMTVHPAAGCRHGTLVNALLARPGSLSTVGGIQRPGIVHRLDKDTSGLIVVAKTDQAHASLQSQIQQRGAHRRYLALVWGKTKFSEAVVDAPIGRHPTDRKKMAVIKDTNRYTARDARTHLTVAERFEHFTLLHAVLDTGRTHQVRVHCAFVGHPVVGDPVYGGTKRAIPPQLCKSDQRDLSQLIEQLQGQALHAQSLAFDHPVTGERLSFETCPPEDMQAILDWLRKSAEKV